MKKRTIGIIAVIMGFSFLALLFLQLQYMQRMVQMKKEQFNESVNRALYQASKNLELNETLRYLEKDINLTDKNTDTAYEASRCLMCGCCLEVCPNFYVGGDFYGAASFVPATRLITAANRGGAEELKREYREHIYKGCGKSLVCKDICPAGIDMDKMLSKSNEVAVWKSLFKR